MNIISKLQKIKKRRLLVISPNQTNSGIQCIYLSTTAKWEILSHSSVPYSQKILSLFDDLRSGKNSNISDIGWLDFKLSSLSVEAAKAALMQVSSAHRLAHYGIFNKPCLWRGQTGENIQQSFWDLSLGDAQYVASTFNIPVMTDFSRQNMIAGGIGKIPTNPGYQIIASQCPGPVVFLNIGHFSHMTIIDPATSSIILDSDTGPGTFLIEKIAKEFNITEGNILTDTPEYNQGKVDGDSLNHLAAAHWFQLTSPKLGDREVFSHLLNNESLRMLSTTDIHSTVTALTARTIYDFFKREYRSNVQPATIYICGNGAGNHTLVEYLSTYFSPVTITNIEQIGVPSEMLVPIVLGLTVDTYLSGVASVPWETGNMPKLESFGRWVIP